jgi:hypothetical protein
MSPSFMIFAAESFLPHPWLAYPSIVSSLMFELLSLGKDQTSSIIERESRLNSYWFARDFSCLIYFAAAKGSNHGLM